MPPQQRRADRDRRAVTRRETKRKETGKELASSGGESGFSEEEEGLIVEM